MTLQVREEMHPDGEVVQHSAALEKPSRHVLLIAYVFPPVGGAGVQRVTKFVKYLPRCGWRVSVLTVSNPSVPLHDASLCDEIPAGTEIFRARTCEPGYGLKSAMVTSTTHPPRGGYYRRAKQRIGGFAKSAANAVLQPDAQILWRPHALAEGMRVLRSGNYDAILASGPPFSTFLLAATLARRSGLPLVLDYRDEWDISNRYWENKRLGPWSLAVQKWMQRCVLRQANAVVATTEASANSLQTLCEESGSGARVRCIYNGFDDEDFDPEGGLPSQPMIPAEANGSQIATSDEPFRLTYVGTLWALTTLAPTARAIAKMTQRHPGLRERFRLVVAGRRLSDEQRIVDELQQQTGVVQQHPYVSHVEAVTLMGQASELLVLLSDLPGVARVLPAKVFEYLATGSPILAIAPRGELWDVLQRFSHVRLFEPSQVGEITDYLVARIRGEVTYGRDVREEVLASGFDRRTQAGLLARLLGEVAPK